jgi:hypothetical protein
MTAARSLQQRARIMACAALLLCIVPHAGAVTPADYARAGILTCRVDHTRGIVVTQTRQLTCTFTPTAGEAETYTGMLRKWGLNAGGGGAGVIVWTVLSTIGAVPAGALEGSYYRSDGDGAPDVGAGPHTLTGGTSRWFGLKAQSASGDITLDFASNVSGLDLIAAQ